MKSPNYKAISVSWTMDESRSWADELLQVFDLLLSDDPVDKTVDQRTSNLHDVNN
jgi:hypothetical protein